jgi:hypothetical protein
MATSPGAEVDLHVLPVLASCGVNDNDKQGNSVCQGAHARTNKKEAQHSSRASRTLQLGYLAVPRSVTGATEYVRLVNPSLLASLAVMVSHAVCSILFVGENLTARPPFIHP